MKSAEPDGYSRINDSLWEEANDALIEVFVARKGFVVIINLFSELIPECWTSILKHN